MESRTSIEVEPDPPDGACASVGAALTASRAAWPHPGHRPGSRPNATLEISDFSRGCGSLAVPRSAQMGLVTVLLSRWARTAKRRTNDRRAA